MWGQLSATYVPSKVAGADEVRKATAAEMANRLPAKPFSALAADYPNSGLDLANFMSGRKFPEDVTTYGLTIRSSAQSTTGNLTFTAPNQTRPSRGRSGGGNFLPRGPLSQRETAGA